MARCFKCDATISGEKPHRSTLCPSCGAAVHVCLNCEFYDKGAPNQCREPQAEWVPGNRKNIANFCDYFTFADTGKEKSSDKDAKKVFADLFKKS